MGNRLHGMLQEDGFSLIELIVALMLLAVISLTLASSLRLGITAWTRVAGGDNRQSEIFFSQRAIRRFVELARPVPIDNVRLEKGLHFAGSADRLRFISRLPAKFGLGGDYLIEFAVRTRASGQKDLVVVPAIHTGAEDEGSKNGDGIETTVVADIASASWSYYGLASERDVPSWSETWQTRLGLPQLIALNVTFPPGGRRVWPPLLIAPRLR